MKMGFEIASFSPSTGIIQNGYETVKIYQSQKMVDDTIKLYNTILEMDSGN